MSAAKIIEIAKKEVGYKEGKNNDTKYGVWFKMNNVPWCMEFVQWCIAQAGESAKAKKTAGCQDFEAWAKREDLIIPVNMVQEGDILLFDFTKGGKSEHTGFALGYNPHTHLIDTVEGNTAADGSGSQANGDGVYLKHRAPSTVRYVVRPKWSNK
jgi:hypothetical protein